MADARRQSELAESVINSGLSVRALEGMLRRERSQKSEPRSPGEGPGVSPHIRDLEERFERAIKTKVSIVPGKEQGKGRIIIEYYSLDDFDRLATALGVEQD